MKQTEQLKGELIDRDIDILDLDPQNPRLPEEIAGKPPSTLLRYFYDHMVLEELAQSFVDNGFFMHEPLIIMPTPKKTSRYTVLEGNRRLAALMILHGRSDAEGLSFDIEVPKGTLDRLECTPFGLHTVGT